MQAVIGDGLLIGVDVATMQYDGAYTTKPDGSLEGAVQYVLPAGVSLITGAPAGVAPRQSSAMSRQLPSGESD